MQRRIIGSGLLVLGLGMGLGLTACSGSSSEGKASEGNATIKVAYQQFGEGKVMANYLAGVKAEFEKANPGKKIQLLPLVASENDYYTKLALMLRSPRTTPDVVYEDTFLINADIKAGYLKPLDSYLATWPAWSQFIDTAKGAAKASDGKTYGVPDGTDTRGLWYNKHVFAKAGLPADWQPKTWADVVTAARQIKAKVPGVTPLNIYASKAAGEGTSMQGFEMLLYGTPNQLYDAKSSKWVVGSKGFLDSLGLVKTVFGEKLTPSPQDATDANLSNTITQQWLPQDKLGIALDGSWMNNNWAKTGAKPWPQWSSVMGQAAMPTQNGEAPGKVSLSGGWTWAISNKSVNADLAWKFITALQTEKNAVKFTVDGTQIAVRKDVAADPTYLEANSKTPVFTEVVAVTQYRPAYPEYPQISNQIQVAMEAVMTGQQTPKQAQKVYDDAVKGIVGPDKTTTQ
jgi:multiple sugar transport system substrate-binding protein